MKMLGKERLESDVFFSSSSAWRNSVIPSITRILVAFTSCFNPRKWISQDGFLLLFGKLSHVVISFLFFSLSLSPFFLFPFFRLLLTFFAFIGYCHCVKDFIITSRAWRMKQGQKGDSNKRSSTFFFFHAFWTKSMNTILRILRSLHNKCNFEIDGVNNCLIERKGYIDFLQDIWVYMCCLIY